MSFNRLLELYRLENSNISFEHVTNLKLSIFAERLEDYRKEVLRRYESDEHLLEVLNLLRRSFFKLTRSFKPYNATLNNELKDNLLKKFYQIKNGYPDLFSSLVIYLARSFNEIIKANENSMVEHIQGYINNRLKRSHRIAIVTKRALSLEEKNNLESLILGEHEINYFTENSFRREIDIFDEIYYIGSPNYFGEYVRNTFKGKEIIFFSYDIFPNYMKPKSDFENINSKGVYSKLYDHISFGKPRQRKVFINLEEKELLNNAISKIIDEQKRTGTNSSDTIEACIVYLENNRFIFVPQDSKIRVFVPEEKNNFVKQKNFNELEEDDYIVIRNESDTKLIAEVADQILKEKATEYRQLQRKWKKRLRYLVESKGLNRLSQILINKFQIKTASPISIRNWCNEDSICPKELPKLLSTLKFSEDEVKDIYIKMKQIFRAHIKAGRLISRKLMNDLSPEIFQELREQGFYTFTSEEFDGASFNIERVVSIDHNRYLIASSNLLKTLEID